MERKGYPAAHYTADAVRSATSTTALVTKLTLTPGLYWFFSTVAGRFKQGGDAVAVTSSTGSPIPANVLVGPVLVRNTVAGDGSQDNRVDAITDTGAGVFECIKILD